MVSARYGSRRLPGKPLAMIAGRTLLDRVSEIARQATDMVGNVSMVVATDHETIADHARTLGHEAVMTSPEITSGSGRAYAAALARTERPDIVINLQGDAPFTPASVIVALIDALRGSDVTVVTPVLRLSWPELEWLRKHKLTTPFSGTTCVRATDGRAMWFSKAILPAIRNEADLRAREPMSPIFGHIGLYGYRFAALERYDTMPQSYYEEIEGLEQLRFLEAGMDILAMEFSLPLHCMSGIDSVEDVAMAESIIGQFGDQHGLWK